jgi:hypothetical protein
MRLDHVSYVASHDQISDVVNRIGSQIGTAFVDGGIHPKFGTRNFTAPLLNGQYIEIVCPLDHPATDATPFGKAVKKKVEQGGGWMAWVLSCNNIEIIEEEYKRKAIDGYRLKPDGSILKWKQLGVSNTLKDFRNPFYIEWISGNHPSSDGIASVKLVKIVISGNVDPNFKYLKSMIDSNIEISYKLDTSSDFGITEVHFEFGDETIVID